ncbi:7 transmembrane receptor-domain-containing protein [Paraphysoderma sedebokerense]|nr:7 transmembrane receptor-domain-containing protein [Paraphysoderma sedebokerense]
MSPPQWILQDERSKIVNNAVLLLSSIGSIVNTILLFRIYRSRRILKVFHMPLLNMVISDTIFAYAWSATYGMHSLYPSLDYIWCHFNSVMAVSLFGLSISSATVISVERYLQIVLGKTISFKLMLGIMVALWVIHTIVGFYPLMVNMQIVPQACETYCLPDFRRSDALHRSYSVVVVLFLSFVLSVIAISYFRIWKNAIAIGFKWNDKTFVLKQGEKELPLHGPATGIDKNIKNVVHLSVKAVPSSIGGRSKNNQSAQEESSASNASSSRNASTKDKGKANAKRMAMTKKLAFVTFAIYWADGKFAPNSSAVIQTRINACCVIFVWRRAVVTWHPLEIQFRPARSRLTGIFSFRADYPIRNVIMPSLDNYS